MKFYIRDLLWLTVVSCVIATSCHYYHKQLDAVKSLEQTIDKQNHTIFTAKEKHDWFWLEGKYVDSKYDYN